MKKSLTSLLLLAALSGTIKAQDSTATAPADSVIMDDMFDLSLEDLLNMDVTVASKKAMSLKESPGIISVISEDEIKSTGARDLIDVLRLVPGIYFNLDVQGQIGISMRGNWGFEGKVLVMMDGQELNENLYGTVMFGDHYDVSQIKRIEIIRGPGSSIYGGYAELGVIHIITKTGEDYQGFNGTYTFGSSKRNALSLGGGHKNGNLEFDIKAYGSQAQRSEEQWTDWYETTGEMNDNSNYSSMMINAGVKYKDLSARVIYDDYRTNTINAFGEVLDSLGPLRVDFTSLLTEVKYDAKITENITIIPKINYNTYAPWVTKEDPYDYGFQFHLQSDRLTGNLAADWDATENINVIIGGEYITESSENQRPEDGPYYYNDSDKLTLSQFSAYGQLMWMNPYVNVVAGGRFMNHSTAGTASAPRLGLTKEMGDFHAKALYSQAFRAPSFENINGSVDDNGDPTITPERTTVYELELGYQIGSKTQVTANIFDITIKDPIIYYYEYVDGENDIERYENNPQSGSRGAELDIRHKNTWGYVNLNYSYQTAAGKLDAPLYEVLGDDKTALGVPQNMIKLNATYNILENLSANVSMAWIDQRYAIRTVEYDADDNEIPIYEKEKSVALLNLFVNYKNLFTEGLALGVGANNLLNTKNTFIQPYANYMSPMPDRSTEVVVRLSYDFKTKK